MDNLILKIEEVNKVKDEYNMDISNARNFVRKKMLIESKIPRMASEEVEEMFMDRFRELYKSGK